jgi:hypothetical protein
MQYTMGIWSCARDSIITFEDVLDSLPPSTLCVTDYNVKSRTRSYSSSIEQRKDPVSIHRDGYGISKAFIVY